ncbi:MAG: hypothetical protein GY854_04525 [Deltaproteobacteria bacterium]|nr:hypothetical protein [Deltaproteobacteria bacterium]
MVLPARHVILALTLCVCLVGCGAQSPPKPDTSPASKEDENAKTRAAYPQAVAEDLEALEARLGRPLDLTVDPVLQAAVEQALQESGKPGAALVIDAKQGAVLALHEVPGIEPHPLTAATHPASTMKTLLALAGIHEKVLSFDETIKCEQDYSPVAGFYCFAKHGLMTLDRALVTSCNVFFFEVANRLDVDNIATHFAHFGIGQATGIELPEPLGILPDRKWYEAHGGYEKKHALTMGIGHGEISVTPLQLARAYTAVSTGKLPKLTLLRSKTEVGDREVSALPYDESSLAKVRKALLASVTDEGGTARQAAVSGLDIAGKTGTAEGKPLDKEVPPPANGWFAGFAPAEDPQVVVVVYIEGGGPGGVSAAPIAGKIFSAWNTR